MSDYDEFNTTMQESLSRVMEPIRKTLSLYSSALAPIKAFEASLDKMIEPYQRLNEQFARSLFSPLSETLQKMSKEISDTISACPNLDMAPLVDSLMKTLIHVPQPIFSSDFTAALKELGRYSFPDDLGGLCDDSDSPDSDYVTVDKSTAKEIDISDTITFPVGHCRVKIKTGDFIALIFGIITIIISIMSYIGQSDSPESVDVQNQLLQSQNQIMYDLLHTMDASSSNQAEALEALKDSVESQNSAISDLEESLDSIEQLIDNKSESVNTEPEN